MVTPGQRDIIIHAIQSLRNRRVRPSFKKISWFVRRQHKISENVLAVLIESMVKSKDILRVYFKGAISYRIPPNAMGSCSAPYDDEETLERLSGCASHIGESSGSDIEDFPSSDTSVSTLKAKHPTDPGKETFSSNFGLAYQGNLASCKARPPVTVQRATLDTLRALAETAVLSTSSSSGNSGTPRSGRSTPGGARVASSDGDSNDVQCIREIVSTAASRLETPKPPVRGGSRRGRPPLTSQRNVTRAPSARNKRAKRVYDPSEGGVVELCTADAGDGDPLVLQNNGRALKRKSSSTDGEGVCEVCHSTAGPEQYDDCLLRCTSCSSAGHPSCLGYGPELAGRSKRTNWKCMDCKHCYICSMDHHIGTLIFCDECDRAFHLTCHRPALRTQPEGIWVCYLCRGDPFQFNGYSPFPLTPGASPSYGEDEQYSWVPDLRIPNAMGWTVDELAAYFEQQGFAEEAKAFKDNAVDGTAMMLMSRNDVLKSLGLKLGPAVKLYRHIRILQTRVPNPPMFK